LRHRDEKSEFEIIFGYSLNQTNQELAFVNNIQNPEGGTHLIGFKSGILKIFNEFGHKNNSLKEKNNLIADDLKSGLIAIISLKIAEPQFEGQTKTKLGNPEVKIFVENNLVAFLKEHFGKNPQELKAILQRIMLNYEARKAAKSAKEAVFKKRLSPSLTLSGKLADCSNKDTRKRELFLVEGDSAGGCFSGNTNIALTDGRNISFKELIKETARGKQNYCYTINENGSIDIAEITNPRLTKKKAAVIKIILDNNEEIICTPDHKFMLRKGSYKEARYLKPEDSLMPLYRQYSKNEIRKFENDKSLIRYETICNRFFEGDENKLQEAVSHCNHKIKKIIPLKEKTDVYDLEVPKTHNFALASGVFVHNSAKSGRDKNTQAVLPLKGKILNVEKTTLDKILKSEEVKNLIISLGTGIGKDFDLGNIRYAKVIIASDADVDGSHIRTLLLTLFYRYFKPVIEAGFVFIAQPPLYKITEAKNVYYAFSDSERDKILKKITKSSDVQRYKGLGEMNPDELWETTLNPEKRVLKKITVEDAEEANRLFNILMGTEVEPRKKFIETYAQEVQNLDI
jgi:DNA gyrase subunit B